MASTYVNDLRLNELATGDASGTWGTITNTNLELIAEKFGTGSEALSDASTATITMQDGTSDAFRSFALTLTGSLSQACTVTLAPNTLSNVWVVQNSAGDTVTLTQGTGSNVVIPNGSIKMIATDGGGSGANVTDVLDVTGGTNNVGLGSGALVSITSGDDNVAIGENAGDALTTGNDNTLVGDNAGTEVTTGFNNTFIGSRSGDAISTADNNVAVGFNSLGSDTK